MPANHSVPVAGRRGLAAAAVAASAAIAWAAVAFVPGKADANPYWAQQTGQSCATCHYGGREREGRGGLNPTGQRFLACGYHFQCGAPPPQYPPQPQYQQPYQPYQPQYQQPYQPQYQQPYQPYPAQPSEPYQQSPYPYR